MQISNPTGTQARGVRRFAVPPQRIWQAFTDPADMAGWMWGGFTKNSEAAADVRVGGRYCVYTDSTATKDGWSSDRIGRVGIYIDVAPISRLVYTCHWDAPVGYNQGGDVVTDEVFIVALAPDPVGTLVQIDHIGIPEDGVSAFEHGRGLGEELETLATLVAG